MLGLRVWGWVRRGFRAVGPWVQGLRFRSTVYDFRVLGNYGEGLRT